MSVQHFPPASGGGSGITQLTGDVTAGPGSGSQAATIAAGAVTEAKISLADNTTDDVTSTKHGFAPKSPADATKFLNGAATPAYAAVKDSDLSTSDITTNNVSSTKHGFVPKSAADATKFLNSAATPAFAQVKDSDLSLTDITTNNVTIAAHGFTPKLPNDATKYLDGTGAYTVPAGTASGTVTTTGSPASGNLTKFSGASSITNGDLSGDVTTSGTLATTIANNAVTTAKINNSAVTLAKIANAAANSKLVGSGASGSGAAYTELSLGAGLSMSGTTLSTSGGSGGSGNVTNTGADASVPGSPNDGDLYFPNDGIYVRRYNSGATTWQPWGPLFPCTEPVSGSFSQVNFSGGDVLSAVGGGFSLLCPTGGSNWRLMVKNIIASHYTVSIGVIPFQAADGNVAFGTILYDGTKLITFHCGYNQTIIQQWNSVSSFHANVSSSGIILYYLNGPVTWMQIQDDGTHRTYRLSCDGQHWNQFYQEATGTWLTETKYGFGVYNSSGTTGNGIRAIHLSEV